MKVLQSLKPVRFYRMIASASHLTGPYLGSIAAETIIKYQSDLTISIQI